MQRLVYKTVLIFGPPGAGKGTWGQILGRIPGFLHFASGDMFRSLSPDSDRGKAALESIRKGELVSDEQALSMWREQLHNLVTIGKFNPEKHVLVLDGLPRTPAQAVEVESDLDIRLILFLDSPDRDLLVQRLYGRALIEHRVDDANEDIIRRRFQVYDDQTNETLEHYSKDLIQQVDVSQLPQKILLDICQHLDERLSG
ncbi:TPA: adenylate kinase [Candidatus Latescibacteria bacterium]|nr:adenylate kinase [Candidatus Latescibacterota bacterium]